jgi:hypothetical protein
MRLPRRVRKSAYRCIAGCAVAALVEIVRHLV